MSMTTLTTFSISFSSIVIIAFETSLRYLGSSVTSFVLSSFGKSISFIVVDIPETDCALGAGGGGHGLVYLNCLNLFFISSVFDLKDSLIFPCVLLIPPAIFSEILSRNLVNIFPPLIYYPLE